MIVTMSQFCYCSLLINHLFTSAFQQTTPPERLFKDKEILLTCIGSGQKIYRVFVSGECRAFFESDCDLVKALVDLISTYYIFNVSYPKSLSGLLHFLQEVALTQSDSKYNLIRYATFMGKFRKKSLNQ